MAFISLEHAIFAVGFGWMAGSALFILRLVGSLRGRIASKSLLLLILIAVVSAFILLGLATIGKVLLEATGHNTFFVVIAVLSLFAAFLLLTYALRQRKNN